MIVPGYDGGKGCQTESTVTAEFAQVLKFCEILLGFLFAECEFFCNFALVTGELCPCIRAKSKDKQLIDR